MSVYLKSEEQSKLVLDNQKLVYYIVNQMDILSSDYEDVTSIGMLGLIKAAASFDEQKDVKFATYATRCIKNEIYMYFRKQKGKMGNLSLETPICEDDEGGEITLGEQISNPEEFTDKFFKRQEIIDLMNIILNVLDSNEKEIILYKIANVKQNLIADKLKVSQSYVSRVEKRVHEKIMRYSKNRKSFHHFFSMEIKNNVYKIRFWTDDVKKIKNISFQIMKNLEGIRKIPDYTIKYEKGSISIIIPCELEAFAFVAEFIHEIEKSNINKKIVI